MPNFKSPKVRCNSEIKVRAIKTQSAAINLLIAVIETPPSLHHNTTPSIIHTTHQSYHPSVMHTSPAFCSSLPIRHPSAPHISSNSCICPVSLPLHEQSNHQNSVIPSQRPRSRPPSPLSSSPPSSSSSSKAPTVSTVTASVSLAESVSHAVRLRFPNADIDRVIKSFASALSGTVLEKDAGKPNHQRASSFLESLPQARQFYDTSRPEFAWVKHLEANYAAIVDEFTSVTAQPDLQEKGTNVWAPPVVEAANAYGPDWRTLVLQDREWDGVNTELFPVTTQLLKEADAPSVEVFFAKQTPQTGIKLHTDDCNFILTMHLGLVVPPEGKSWIEVGGVKKPWEQGKSIVFDTSYFHQTMNEHENMDRVVLLIRFWHPNMTGDERTAMDYLFQLIGHGEEHPDIVKAKEELLERNDINGKRKKKGKVSSSSAAPRGFGKK